VLLQREVADGVEILSLRGPVSANDAKTLAGALADAIALQPRAALIDLTDSGQLGPHALAVIDNARPAAPGWPRPALIVCCMAQERDGDQVRLGVAVHADRGQGLAHADDRSTAPRQRIRLEHSAQSPGLARAAAVRMLSQFPGTSEELADEVCLVVSELVTNAVRHARPPVDLEIEVAPTEVLIAVEDGSPGRPGPVHPPSESEGGRGLQMVHVLASELGVRPHPEGKTVWAAVRRPSH